MKVVKIDPRMSGIRLYVEDTTIVDIFDSDSPETEKRIAKIIKGALEREG